MRIRAFQPRDAEALASLSGECARGETDFVLNPLWETADELFAEFGRFGIDPEEHLLVAEAAGEVVGMSGYLRHPQSTLAGMCCPIVRRADRGRGAGGELLRATLGLGAEKLGIKLVSAGIGTRNRAGYALLSSQGFRPMRQHFLMRCDTRPAPEPPGDDIELCEAALADAEAILALYTACGFEERDLSRMRAHLQGSRHAFAVARHAGHVVAFVELETHWPRRVWVSFVGVESELRAQGLGSRLVAWAVAQRFDAGADTALLLLSPANRTAVRAYEKAGFRRHRMVDVLEKGL